MLKMIPIAAVLAFFVVVALFLAAFFMTPRDKESGKITNFEECAAAGYPVMESYPRQCRTPDGKVFAEEVPGVLAGKATVGPICPVEREGVPCPAPSEAYTSREIVVYAADGKTLAARTNFDGDGIYTLKLPPGTYIVDIGKLGVDSARGLPREITITAGETTVVNVDIDTGIR